MDNTAPDLKRDRWMMFIPVMLLLGVWVLQVTLTQTHDLTPWKGGGFGMFSVTSQRDLVITVVDAEGQRLPVDSASIEDRHRRLYWRTLAMPSSESLCHLAEVLGAAALRRVPVEQTAIFAENQGAWWRAIRRADKDAEPTAWPKHTPTVTLSRAPGGSTSARPLVEPVEMTLGVSRVRVDVDAGRVVTEGMPTSVRWSKGRCEVTQ